MNVEQTERDRTIKVSRGGDRIPRSSSTVNNDRGFVRSGACGKPDTGKSRSGWRANYGASDEVPNAAPGGPSRNSASPPAVTKTVSLTCAASHATTSSAGSGRRRSRKASGARTIIARPGAQGQSDRSRRLAPESTPRDSVVMGSQEYPHRLEDAGSAVPFSRCASDVARPPAGYGNAQTCAP